jgi:hypothetical protein
MSSSNGTPIERLTRRVLKQFVEIRCQIEIERHDNKQVQKRLRIAAKYERLQIAIAHSMAPPSLSTHANHSPKVSAVYHSDRDENVDNSAGRTPSPAVPTNDKGTLPSQTWSAESSSDDEQDSDAGICSDAGSLNGSIPRTLKRNSPIFKAKAKKHYSVKILVLYLIRKDFYTTVPVVHTKLQNTTHRC